MHPNGFMLHKYQPDRSVGSTWHPQMHSAHPELPIQEDETASVLVALARYIEFSQDYDFARTLYAHFIKPCSNFMAQFIDEKTNLPHASYDLWEQKFATFTYTVYVTLKALEEVSKIAEKLNCYEDKERWSQAADKIRAGAHLLVNPDSGAYRKSLLLNKDDNLEFENTIDASSFFGAMQYSADFKTNVLSRSVQMVEDILLKSSPIGGVPRYEHDDYFLSDHTKLGNPWAITTLWLARYYISNGRIEDGKRLMDWVMARATPSGMLAEQFDPNTGMGTGVSPLVWSHSTFAETAVYLANSN